MSEDKAKRVALVVGNANYTHAGSLKNPANDTAAMAERLNGLGFEVIGGSTNGTDLSYGAFAERLRDFGRALREADVALLFFAGHGLQVNGPKLPRAGRRRRRWSSRPMSGQNCSNSKRS